ncbi:MAG: hypothetical protein AB7I24_07215 [Candidatus Nanopelagicales bacterium]
MSGRRFDLNPDDLGKLTGLEAMALQRSLGMSLEQVAHLLATGLDRREFAGDLLPALLFMLWIANRRAGDRRTDFETFADSIEIGTLSVVPDDSPADAAVDESAAV